MKFLIFDTILDGHHSDYMAHLVEYWCMQQVPGELWVVTPEGFQESLALAYRSYPGLRCVELTEQELRQARRGSWFGRSFAEWNLYLKYAGQIRPDRAILMYFDLFQLGLWLGKRSPCALAGIYFRPSFHYAGQYPLKEQFVAFRKKWILKRVLSVPELSTLYCLDKSSVKTIQQMSPRVSVLPLSDPVKSYEVSADEVEALRLSLGVQPGRMVFLMFGYLDNRKGIETVLDAIGQLSEEESARLALVLAGPITDSYRQVIEARIASIRSNAQVICRYTRFTGAAIQVLFELSDVVLTLYRRHIGMSSIVVRAAVSHKPLISSDFGYMGTLVRQEGLGIVIDSESTAAIREALSRALRGEMIYSDEATSKFSAQNTSWLYAHQILGALIGSPSIPS